MSVGRVDATVITWVVDEGETAFVIIDDGVITLSTMVVETIVEEGTVDSGLVTEDGQTGRSCEQSQWNGGCRHKLMSTHTPNDGLDWGRPEKQPYIILKEEI